ncbi:hypothetical protein LOD99_16016 [Oopsacas minuta]|uniref:SprT-like domain-containing protein n=1 Tax=Oopsacas minuta TaxID=111878 RepID=A0AAV7K686_9METZ|nr:hypothetical protein LOD99_16016 [Oopsacas minuta]
MAEYLEEDFALALALSQEFSNEIIPENERDEEWLDELLSRDTIDEIIALEVTDNIDWSFDSEYTLSTPLTREVPPIYHVTHDYHELNDPTPSIHQLFTEFNQLFFYNKLGSVSVEWSYRMTSCAGITYYSPRSHFCYIRLSKPILSLRPRKDLVETLLHEMIHAFLFVAENNRDHTDHGPQFQTHQLRINSLAKCTITIYHTFHDEVSSLRNHWWRCVGPCRYRQPYYGYVKRAVNRPPSKSDQWWSTHLRTCGGKFVKIRSPDKTTNLVNKNKTINKSPTKTTTKNPKKIDNNQQTLNFKSLVPIEIEDYDNPELISDNFTPPNSPIVISSPETETETKQFAEASILKGQLQLKQCYFCGGFFELGHIVTHFENCITYFPEC